MTLQEFMTANDLDDVTFGALVGKDRSTVSRWRRGETKPSWNEFPLISRVTKGRVTANDFVVPEAAQ